MYLHTPNLESGQRKHHPMNASAPAGSLLYSCTRENEGLCCLSVCAEEAHIHSVCAELHEGLLSCKMGLSEVERSPPPSAARQTSFRWSYRKAGHCPEDSRTGLTCSFASVVLPLFWKARLDRVQFSSSAENHPSRERPGQPTSVTTEDPFFYGSCDKDGAYRCNADLSRDVQSRRSGHCLLTAVRSEGDLRYKYSAGASSARCSDGQTDKFKRGSSLTTGLTVLTASWRRDVDTEQRLFSHRLQPGQTTEYDLHSRLPRGPRHQLRGIQCCNEEPTPHPYSGGVAANGDDSSVLWRSSTISRNGDDVPPTSSAATSLHALEPPQNSFETPHSARPVETPRKTSSVPERALPKHVDQSQGGYMVGGEELYPYPYDTTTTVVPGSMSKGDEAEAKTELLARKAHEESHRIEVEKAHNRMRDHMADMLRFFDRMQAKNARRRTTAAFRLRTAKSSDGAATPVSYAALHCFTGSTGCGAVCGRQASLNAAATSRVESIAETLETAPLRRLAEGEVEIRDNSAAVPRTKRYEPQANPAAVEEKCATPAMLRCTAPTGKADEEKKVDTTHSEGITAYASGIQKPPTTPASKDVYCSAFRGEEGSGAELAVVNKELCGLARLPRTTATTAENLRDAQGSADGEPRHAKVTASSKTVKAPSSPTNEIPVLKDLFLTTEIAKEARIKTTSYVDLKSAGEGGGMAHEIGAASAEKGALLKGQGGAGPCGRVSSVPASSSRHVIPPLAAEVAVRTPARGSRSRRALSTAAHARRRSPTVKDRAQTLQAAYGLDSTLDIPTRELKQTEKVAMHEINSESSACRNRRQEVKRETRIRSPETQCLPEVAIFERKAGDLSVRNLHRPFDQKEGKQRTHEQGAAYVTSSCTDIVRVTETKESCRHYSPVEGVQNSCLKSLEEAHEEEGAAAASGRQLKTYDIEQSGAAGVILEAHPLQELTASTEGAMHSANAEGGEDVKAEELSYSVSVQNIAVARPACPIMLGRILDKESAETEETRCFTHLQLQATDYTGTSVERAAGAVQQQSDWRMQEVHIDTENTATKQLVISGLGVQEEKVQVCPLFEETSTQHVLPHIGQEDNGGRIFNGDLLTSVAPETACAEDIKVQWSVTSPLMQAEDVSPTSKISVKRNEDDSTENAKKYFAQCDTALVHQRTAQMPTAEGEKAGFSADYRGEERHGDGKGNAHLQHYEKWPIKADTPLIPDNRAKEEHILTYASDAKEADAAASDVSLSGKHANAAGANGMPLKLTSSGTEVPSLEEARLPAGEATKSTPRPLTSPVLDPCCEKEKEMEAYAEDYKRLAKEVTGPGGGDAEKVDGPGSVTSHCGTSSVEHTLQTASLLGGVTHSDCLDISKGDPAGRDSVVPAAMRIECIGNDSTNTEIRSIQDKVSVEEYEKQKKTEILRVDVDRDKQWQQANGDGGMGRERGANLAQNNIETTVKSQKRNEYAEPMAVEHKTTSKFEQRAGVFAEKQGPRTEAPTQSSCETGKGVDCAFMDWCARSTDPRVLRLDSGASTVPSSSSATLRLSSREDLSLEDGTQASLLTRGESDSTTSHSLDIALKLLEDAPPSPSVTGAVPPKDSGLASPAVEEKRDPVERELVEADTGGSAVNTVRSDPEVRDSSSSLEDTEKSCTSEDIVETSSTQDEFIRSLFEEPESSKASCLSANSGRSGTSQGVPAFTHTNSSNMESFAAEGLAEVGKLCDNATQSPGTQTTEAAGILPPSCVSFPDKIVDGQKEEAPAVVASHVFSSDEKGEKKKEKEAPSVVASHVSASDVNEGAEKEKNSPSVVAGTSLCERCRPRVLERLWPRAVTPVAPFLRKRGRGGAYKTRDLALLSGGYWYRETCEHSFRLAVQRLRPRDPAYIASHAAGVRARAIQHNILLSTHREIQRSRCRVRSMYYWPKSFVHACASAVLTKATMMAAGSLVAPLCSCSLESEGCRYCLPDTTASAPCDAWPWLVSRGHTGLNANDSHSSNAKEASCLHSLPAERAQGTLCTCKAGSIDLEKLALMVGGCYWCEPPADCCVASAAPQTGCEGRSKNHMGNTSSRSERQLLPGEHSLPLLSQQNSSQQKMNTRYEAERPSPLQQSGGQDSLFEGNRRGSHVPLKVLMDIKERPPLIARWSLADADVVEVAGTFSPSPWKDLYRMQWDCYLRSFVLDLYSVAPQDMLLRQERFVGLRVDDRHKHVLPRGWWVCPMNPTAKEEAVLQIAVKFRVDGVWRCEAMLPIHRDEQGRAVNLLVVYQGQHVTSTSSHWGRHTQFFFKGLDLSPLTYNPSRSPAYQTDGPVLMHPSAEDIEIEDAMMSYQRRCWNPPSSRPLMAELTTLKSCTTSTVHGVSEPDERRETDAEKHVNEEASPEGGGKPIGGGQAHPEADAEPHARDQEEKGDDPEGAKGKGEKDMEAKKRSAFTSDTSGDVRPPTTTVDNGALLQPTPREGEKQQQQRCVDATSNYGCEGADAEEVLSGDSATESLPKSSDSEGLEGRTSLLPICREEPDKMPIVMKKENADEMLKREGAGEMPTRVIEHATERQIWCREAVNPEEGPDLGKCVEVKYTGKKPSVGRGKTETVLNQHPKTANDTEKAANAVIPGIEESGGEQCRLVQLKHGSQKVPLKTDIHKNMDRELSEEERASMCPALESADSNTTPSAPNSSLPLHVEADDTRETPYTPPVLLQTEESEASEAPIATWRALGSENAPVSTKHAFECKNRDVGNKMQQCQHAKREAGSAVRVEQIISEERHDSDSKSGAVATPYASETVEAASVSERRRRREGEDKGTKDIKNTKKAEVDDRSVQGTAFEGPEPQGARTGIEQTGKSLCTLEESRSVKPCAPRLTRGFSAYESTVGVAEVCPSIPTGHAEGGPAASQSSATGALRRVSTLNNSYWPQRVTQYLQTPDIFHELSTLDIAGRRTSAEGARMKKGLTLQCGSYMIPHPDKTESGGADAFFIATPVPPTSRYSKRFACMDIPLARSSTPPLRSIPPSRQRHRYTLLVLPNRNLTNSRTNSVSQWETSSPNQEKAKDVYSGTRSPVYRSCSTTISTPQSLSFTEKSASPDPPITNNHENVPVSSSAMSPLYSSSERKTVDYDGGALDFASSCQGQSQKTSRQDVKSATADSSRNTDSVHCNLPRDSRDAGQGFSAEARAATSFSEDSATVRGRKSGVKNTATYISSTTVFTDGSDNSSSAEMSPTLPEDEASAIQMLLREALEENANPGLAQVLSACSSQDYSSACAADGVTVVKSPEPEPHHSVSGSFICAGAAVCTPPRRPAGAPAMIAGGYGSSPKGVIIGSGGEEGGAVCVGVADGVGEWDSFGLNPRLFAEELMRGCCEAAHEAWFWKMPAVEQRALEVLRRGYKAARSYGSCTALVACLDTRSEKMGIANLGDSGVIILRRQHQPRFVYTKMTCVHRSREQQHNFNCPYQLSRLPAPSQYQQLAKDGKHSLVRVLRNATMLPQDTPEMADVYTVNTLEGDLILLGTDGLFDNLFDHEICALANAALSPYEAALLNNESLATSADAVAAAVAEAAAHRSRDPLAKTPFMRHARRAQTHFVGGKMDDITVVACWVTRGQLPPDYLPEESEHG